MDKVLEKLTRWIWTDQIIERDWHISNSIWCWFCRVSFTWLMIMVVSSDRALQIQSTFYILPVSRCIVYTSTIEIPHKMFSFVEWKEIGKIGMTQLLSVSLEISLNNNVYKWKIRFCFTLNRVLSFDLLLKYGLPIEKWLMTASTVHYYNHGFFSISVQSDRQRFSFILAIINSFCANAAWWK